MALPTHNTLIRDAGLRYGEYPVALRDAIALLIEERQNLVPVYMPGRIMNTLDARVATAKARDGIDAELEGRAMALTIDSSRGRIKDMVKGMKECGTFTYIQGIIFSNDLASPNPAIVKPQDPDFSFEFGPKTFDLGLTGRLLEDSRGDRFQENLFLDCSIYEVFDLAVKLFPKRIVAVNAQGRHTVVYEDDKHIGRTEAVQNPNGRVNYIFAQDQLDEMRRCLSWKGGVQVLPTGGLNVAFSDFYEKTKKYGRGVILFGHEYANLREFLSKVTASNKHLIWRICANDRGENTPLVDCEETYGLGNNVCEMPENKNRLLYVPSNSSLNLKGTAIFFDRATAIQALASLGDVITDIWLEPVDRPRTEGWDIVYDKMRRITPDKPVPVITNEDMRKHYVWKENIARTTQTIH